MKLNEMIFTICPVTPIQESPNTKDEILLSQCLPFEHEFKAAIKELNYAEKTIHIRGNLNLEWFNKVETALSLRRDIEMPIRIENDTFYAEISTLQL